MFILISGLAHGAADVPPNEKGVTKEVNLRAFYKATESTMLIASVEVKDPDFDEQLRVFHMGGRYSLSENFKFGVFAGMIQKLRHNNNWIRENGLWKWNNKTNKNEYVFYPELSYRDMFYDLVYEIKIKYVYSDLFNEQDFFTKFSLIYNQSPAWTYVISDEIKFSLRNMEKTLSENWIYLSAFYKLNSVITAGPTAGYFQRFWTTSDFHKSIRTNTYKTSDNSYSLGLNVNFYLN